MLMRALSLTEEAALYSVGLTEVTILSSLSIEDFASTCRISLHPTDGAATPMLSFHLLPQCLLLAPVEDFSGS